MDAQAIATVSLGLYPRVPSPECCRSRILSRPPPCSSETRISKVSSSSNSCDGLRDGVRLGGRGMRTSRREEKAEGLAGSLKRETMRPLMAVTVVCANGRAGDGAVQRKDDGVFPSNSDILRTSPGRRAGGAHPSRDENREWNGKHWDGRDGHASADLDRKWSDGEYSRGDSSERGGTHWNKSVHTSDERLRESRRHYLDEDGKEGFRESGPGKRGGEHDHSMARQSTLNIPKSELMKIEELMYSGDLREGDSGRQVLNLQRALFWLGHLRGLSLTGYFGSETTRALQEFHYSHGISSLGVWGHHSQQVLWKRLHPEANRRKLAGGNSEKPVMDGKSETWPVQFSRAVKVWPERTLKELVASVSSIPHSKGPPGKVGVILLGIVVFLSIYKLLQFSFGQTYDQPRRRRILGWQRNDARKRLPRTSTQAFLSRQLGTNKWHAGESDVEDHSADHLARSGQDMSRSDYFENGNKFSGLDWDELTQTQKDNIASYFVALPKSKSAPHLSKGEAQKISDGNDQPQILKVDPLRKFSPQNLSLTRSGNSPKQSKVCPQLDLSQNRHEELPPVAVSGPETRAAVWRTLTGEPMLCSNSNGRRPGKKLSASTLRQELEVLREFNESLLISLQKRRIVSQVVGRASNVHHRTRVMKNSGTN